MPECRLRRLVWRQRTGSGMPSAVLAPLWNSGFRAKFVACMGAPFSDSHGPFRAACGSPFRGREPINPIKSRNAVRLRRGSRRNIPEAFARDLSQKCGASNGFLAALRLFFLHFRYVLGLFRLMGGPCLAQAHRLPQHHRGGVLPMGRWDSCSAAPSVDMGEDFQIVSRGCVSGVLAFVCRGIFFGKTGFLFRCCTPSRRIWVPPAMPSMPCPMLRRENFLDSP